MAGGAHRRRDLLADVVHSLGHRTAGGRTTVALVTGATRGIGLETARQLVDLGHDVYVGARDPRRGEHAPTGTLSDEAGLLPW